MVNLTGRVVTRLAAIGAMGFWCHCTAANTRPVTSPDTRLAAFLVDWDDDPRPLDPITAAEDDWVDSWNWYITYIDSANIA